MVKLHDNTNLWQLVISVLSLLVIFAGSAFTLAQQVTRNEEKITDLKEDIVRTQDRHQMSEDKINKKLDQIIIILTETRINLERKQDRD